MLIRRHAAFIALFSAILTAMSIHAARSQTYTVTDLGTLGGSVTYARDINNNGQIAGVSDTADGTHHAFFWQNGILTDIGPLPGGSFALGIGLNDIGQVVGTTYYTGGLTRPFLWQNGVLHDLGVFPDAAFPEALAQSINNNGQFVGSGYTSLGSHGMLGTYDTVSGTVTSRLEIGRPGSTYSDLEHINQSGTVAGTSDTGVKATDGNYILHAFVSNGTTYQDIGTLSGYYNSWAYGLNNTGHVVGNCNNINGDIPGRAFFYNGSMHDIGTLGGATSIARAINDSDAIVGYSNISDGETHPFVYRNGIMTDLTTQIGVNSDWQLGYAYAINTAGQIVGQGYHNGQTRAFLLTPIVPTHIGTATAIAAGPDGKTRILWDKTDGTATVWTLNAAGSVASYGASYGPLAGWTAKTISVGADDGTRILWTNTNGTMSVWTLPSGSSIPTYGPVYGPYTGWTAKSIATDTTNATHVLWNNANGSMTLWTLPTSGSPTYSSAYGPITGWTAKAIAVGTGSLVHVLWTNTNGAMTLWTVPATGSPTYSPVFGPYAGWTATALSVDTNGATHVLWDNTDGRMTLWTLPATGSPAYSPVFGPYASFSAVGLSIGASNYSHILWDNVSGAMTPWTLNTSNQNVGTFPTYGPF